MNDNDYGFRDNFLGAILQNDDFTVIRLDRTRAFFESQPATKILKI